MVTSIKPVRSTTKWEVTKIKKIPDNWKINKNRPKKIQANKIKKAISMMKDGELTNIKNSQMKITKSKNNAERNINNLSIENSLYHDVIEEAMLGNNRKNIKSISVNKEKCAVKKKRKTAKKVEAVIATNTSQNVDLRSIDLVKKVSDKRKKLDEVSYESDSSGSITRLNSDDEWLSDDDKVEIDKSKSRINGKLQKVKHGDKDTSATSIASNRSEENLFTDDDKEEKTNSMDLDNVLEILESEDSNDSGSITRVNTSDDDWLTEEEDSIHSDNTGDGDTTEISKEAKNVEKTSTNSPIVAVNVNNKVKTHNGNVSIQSEDSKNTECKDLETLSIKSDNTSNITKADETPTKSNSSSHHNTTNSINKNIENKLNQCQENKDSDESVSEGESDDVKSESFLFIGKHGLEEIKNNYEDDNEVDAKIIELEESDEEYELKISNDGDTSNESQKESHVMEVDSSDDADQVPSQLDNSTATSIEVQDSQSDSEKMSCKDSINHSIGSNQSSIENQQEENAEEMGESICEDEESARPTEPEVTNSNINNSEIELLETTDENLGLKNIENSEKSSDLSQEMNTSSVHDQSSITDTNADSTTTSLLDSSQISNTTNEDDQSVNINNTDTNEIIDSKEENEQDIFPIRAKNNYSATNKSVLTDDEFEVGKEVVIDSSESDLSQDTKSILEDDISNVSQETDVGQEIETASTTNAPLSQTTSSLDEESNIEDDDADDLEKSPHPESLNNGSSSTEASPKSVTQELSENEIISSSFSKYPLCSKSLSKDEEHSNSLSEKLRKSPKSPSPNSNKRSIDKDLSTNESTMEESVNEENHTSASAAFTPDVSVLTIIPQSPLGQTSNSSFQDQDETNSDTIEVKIIDNRKTRSQTTSKSEILNVESESGCKTIIASPKVFTPKTRNQGSPASEKRRTRTQSVICNTSNKSPSTPIQPSDKLSSPVSVTSSPTLSKIQDESINLLDSPSKNSDVSSTLLRTQSESSQSDISSPQKSTPFKSPKSNFTSPLEKRRTRTQSDTLKSPNLGKIISKSPILTKSIDETFSSPTEKRKTRSQSESSGTSDIISPIQTVSSLTKLKSPNSSKRKSSESSSSSSISPHNRKLRRISEPPTALKNAEFIEPTPVKRSRRLSEKNVEVKSTVTKKRKSEMSSIPEKDLTSNKIASSSQEQADEKLDFGQEASKDSDYNQESSEELNQSKTKTTPQNKPTRRITRSRIPSKSTPRPTKPIPGFHTRHSPGNYTFSFFH